MYSAKIMELFKNPKNVGALRESDGIGTVYSDQCSDVLKIFIVVDEKSKTITDAHFQVLGGAAAFAVGSVTTELLIGKTVDEALQITSGDIFNAVGKMPDDKVYLTELAKQTIADAIDDYARKLERQSKKGE